MEGHIEWREFGYYVKGSRVSLDSIVYAFRKGASCEAIQKSFPSLTLVEVEGAIRYYLENRPHIDKYLADFEVEYEKEKARLNTEFERTNPDLVRRLKKARKLFHDHMSLDEFDAGKFEQLLRENNLCD